jgi:hypothetical protein
VRTLHAQLPSSPPHARETAEVLLRELPEPASITQVDFAAHIGVPVRPVDETVPGKTGVSPETAWLRFSACARSTCARRAHDHGIRGFEWVRDDTAAGAQGGRAKRPAGIGSASQESR